jgi:hypothetical protein
VHWGVVRLILEGLIVHMVASEAQGEDDESEEVASVVGATEYTSQVALSVLYKEKKESVLRQ